MKERLTTARASWWSAPFFQLQFCSTIWVDLSDFGRWIREVKKKKGWPGQFCIERSRETSRIWNLILQQYFLLAEWRWERRRGIYLVHLYVSHFFQHGIEGSILKIFRLISCLGAQQRQTCLTSAQLLYCLPSDHVLVKISLVIPKLCVRTLGWSVIN